MTFPSLELRWLARHDKDLPLPEIIFTPSNLDFRGQKCGGCYYKPEQNEFLYGDLFIPFDKGVIVVGTESPELIAGTIAHEWRHHWQFHRGLSLEPSHYDPKAFEEYTGYRAAVRKYFRTQAHELDALRYQNKVAPDWCSDYVMECTFGTNQ